MKVTVNKTELDLFSGATVLDALRAYYAQRGMPVPGVLPRVTDTYGNRVATDGELTDGNKLIIKTMKKTIRHRKPLLLALALAALLGQGCGTSRQAARQEATAGKTVHILAVNDMHAAIDNMPRFAFMADSLRAAYPGLLVISAGDNQTGNPVNDQYPEKGMPMIEMMNAIGFDLSAVGNHEFDTKPDGFARTIDRAAFDFLCANLTPPGDGRFPIKPYKIVEAPGGLKVAFASVLHINENGIPDSHPDNLKDFTFTDPFATARQYLHLADSSDVFIYLTHLGFENDVALAEQLPAGIVDMIIGGHSHTLVDKDQVHNGIMITQAERKLKYATLITLAVQPGGKVKPRMQLLPVGNKGAERADIRAMVDKFNDNPALKETVAVADEDLTSYEQVGYLMVDALRAGAGADIALINPGGVRIDHLSRGNVSTMDVYSMDPFGNEAVLFRLTGAEIRSMHMNAFKLDEYLPIYPSGMKSRYTLGADGNVTEIDLFMPDGTPVEMEKIYTVAMNSYMASVYKYEHRDPGTGLFRPTAEIMIEYLRELKRIPGYRDERRVEFIKK